MEQSDKHNNFSQSTINELFHLVKTALIREQLEYRDQTENLSLLYVELTNRDRLDVYDDAVSSAISQMSIIEDFKAGSTSVNIRRNSSDSRYELSELLRRAFKTAEEKPEDAVKISDILDIFGMDNTSFICDVTGQSMIEANIFEGDTLVVNPDKNPSDGDLVVVKFDNYLFVKRFVKSNGSEYFVSENTAYQPVKIEDISDFEILGIVKSVIHRV